MKSKLLAAAAAFAFVATGVAYAQETPRREQTPQRVERPAPAAERPRPAEPRAAEAQPREEPRREAQPRAAEAQPREEPKREAQPRAAQAQPREEPKREAQPRAAETKPREEQPRAAEAKPREEPRREGQPRDAAGADRDKAAAARPMVHAQISREHARQVGQLLQRHAHPERFDGAVRVGVQVPSDVTIYPVPEDVVEIVPEYRGYDYFIDSNNEIVFVSPDSHEVVGVVDYEGRAASEDATQVVGARPCPVEN